MAAVDELMDDPGIIARHPAFQADQQPVKPSGQVLVKAASMGVRLGPLAAPPARVHSSTRPPMPASRRLSAYRWTVAIAP